ncbi:MAG: diguanylate cyclase [Gaiellales bacterium]|nr:MAG: diguanylate cyclase [Gaiellales bacterium]
MKLQYKLYLFFAGVVLLPLLVATITASAVLGRSGADTYKDRMRSSLSAASSILSSQALALAGELESGLQSADTGALASGDAALAERALAGLAQEAGALAAAVIDDSGATIASTGSADGGEPMVAAYADLSGSGGARLRVAIYRPLATEALADVFTAQDLEWGLVDEGQTAQGSFPAGSELAAGVPLFDLPSGGAGENFHEVGVGDGELLAAFIRIPPEVISGEALLFAGVGTDVVSRASRQALTAGVASMLLLSALAAILGYFLTRTITSPLRRLTEAAVAGIEGDLERRVEPGSGDEMGILVDSFNRMQESIKGHIADLEESRKQMLLALSYAGEILGATTDRERLIEITAQAARLATGVDGAQVRLFPVEGSNGHVELSSSVPAARFGGRLDGLALDLSSRVAAGEEILEKTLDAGDGRRLMAFPLLHGENALGSLVVLFGEDRPLDESGRKILGSLALQAASALENVDYGELQHSLAITDQMTGLFNYHFFDEYMQRELNRSRRYRHEMAVAIADLDDFKRINDSFGHLAGDALLRAVADTMRKGVREADVVARYGGEEIVVVFPETNKAAARTVVEKLRKEIALLRLDDYPEVRVTASIGVAGFPQDAGDMNDLLKLTDDALYRSKLAGKNRVTAA